MFTNFKIEVFSFILRSGEIYDAAELHSITGKVRKDTERKAIGLQVCVDLLDIPAAKTVAALELHHDFALNQKIEVVRPNPATPKDEWSVDLLSELNASCPERFGYRLLVIPLPVTRAKLVIYVEKDTNDPVAEIPMNEREMARRHVSVNL